jgi:hypothetical protein
VNFTVDNVKSVALLTTQRGKQFQHLSVETRDLQQLFFLYILLYFVALTYGTAHVSGLNLIFINTDAVMHLCLASGT